VILYLDASALVKRYVAEAGSAEVGDMVDRAAVVGTSILSRIEVPAVIAKAARMKIVTRPAAAAAIEALASDWESLVRLQVNEVLVSRAADLAWDHGLRGYDAAHLAAAELWQDLMGDTVTLATFDVDLWEAACRSGLVAWPARQAR
jgi:hypothetical protein